MTESKTPITVHILGKEYAIVCPAEEEHALLAAARYLDEQMRSIRNTGRVVGTERIAVMVALNIAHELIQLQAQGATHTSGLSQRLAAMHKKLDAELD